MTTQKFDFRHEKYEQYTKTSILTIEPHFDTSKKNKTDTVVILASQTRRS